MNLAFETKPSQLPALGCHMGAEIVSAKLVNMRLNAMLKRWWHVDLLGQCFLTINYGSKKLELDKGKSAIAVGSKDNLVSTIDAVIAAVEAGELDAAISATQKTGQKPRAKAA